MSVGQCGAPGAAPQRPSAPLLSHSTHCVVLLLESLLFGVFVTVVFYDQVGAEVWGGQAAVGRAVTSVSPTP